MAIVNKLQVFDEQGNLVDYDILASDVKFLPDGKDLPTKLDEMQDDIDHAGQGDGTVTGVKVGSTTYEPTDGVVDLSTPMADKVDKETGKSLMTDAERTKLQNLPTADQLTQQLGGKANDADVVKGVSVNGTAQTKDGNGNVNIEVEGGGLSEEDVSVATSQNGTFTITIGDKSYTIDLRHDHPQYLKFQLCETEAAYAALPTKDSTTLYLIPETT